MKFAVRVTCIFSIVRRAGCVPGLGGAVWSIFVISPLPVWMMLKMLRSRGDDRSSRCVRV